MAKSTKYLKYPAYLFWAKLKEENRDMGPQDGSKLAKRIDQEEGRYTVDLHISESTKNQMIQDGIPEEVLGYAQFKESEEYDNYWVYRAKRPHRSPTLVDEETGENVVFGPPEVIDLSASLEAEEKCFIKGLLGNGTEAEIKLSNWNDSIITLVGVAVKELVEYETEDKVW